MKTITLALFSILLISCNDSPRTGGMKEVGVHNKTSGYEEMCEREKDSKLCEKN